MLTGLTHSHSGLAYLVVLCCFASLALALATATLGPKATLMKVASVLRIAEASLMGIIGLLGIALWLMIGWPLTTWFTWVGVIAFIAHGPFTARGIKPAQALASQGASAWRWVGLELAHTTAVLLVFGAMHMK